MSCCSSLQTSKWDGCTIRQEYPRYRRCTVRDDCRPRSGSSTRLCRDPAFCLSEEVKANQVIYLIFFVLRLHHYNCRWVAHCDTCLCVSPIEVVCCIEGGATDFKCIDRIKFQGEPSIQIELEAPRHGKFNSTSLILDCEAQCRPIQNRDQCWRH